MNKKYFISIIILISFTTLFSLSKMKVEAYPQMYENSPKSILVLPPINYSTAADAKEYLSSTITKPLAEAGYYVFPIDVTDELLKSEGLYDTEIINDNLLPQFHEIIGADAVLIPELLYWDKNYYIIGGNVKVGVRYTLKSTLTKKVIWIYEGIMVVDTSNNQNTGGGMAGLLIGLAATAMKTAAQDYFPIAEQVNKRIFKNIPYGYYHPKFDSDQNNLVHYPKKNAEFMKLASSNLPIQHSSTDSLKKESEINPKPKTQNQFQAHKKRRNKNLQYVVLNSERVISGVVVLNKKKKIALQKGDILVTIYKKAIKRIEDGEKKDITETIYSRKYGKFNYNKFTDFEEIKK